MSNKNIKTKAKQSKRKVKERREEGAREERLILTGISETHKRLCEIASTAHTLLYPIFFFSGTHSHTSSSSGQAKRPDRQVMQFFELIVSRLFCFSCSRARPSLLV
jgi:hypothetical protein